jgi:hypothetical protein
MKLTRRQEAILLGIVLGDGFLQKTGLKNARLRLEHGSGQKEYLLWKGKQFPRLFLGKPIGLKRAHPKTKQVYEYWRWQSNSTPILGKWRNLFYPNGKKKIPEELGRILKEKISLAVWYMDDGYFYNKDYNCCSYIYLGRVLKKEAEIAASAIHSNFNISAKIYDKKQKGYALFFPVSETKKMHDLIRAQILPMFSYKLYTP